MAQIYEDYWKVTMAYTDINKKEFIGTLRIIRDFIDRNNEPFSKHLYKRLQEDIQRQTGIQKLSVRKAINQFIKLGFVKPHLVQYISQTNEFLNATTDRRRMAVFSQVIYNYSNFNSSTTKSSTVTKHINFLVKTLEYMGCLGSDDIAALMTIDITNRECIKERKELDLIRANMKSMKFLDRKYNQLSHLCSILSKMEGLVFKKGALYFQEDAERLFPEDHKRIGRDPYLHRVFKEELKHESEEALKQVGCMVENIFYPVLIASHIKPFKVAEPDEQYDRFNGLLLTRSMDALFDRGDISFEDDGGIIITDGLPQATRSYLSGMRINKLFLAPKRLDYLEHHRNHVYKA